MCREKLVAMPMTAVQHLQKKIFVSHFKFFVFSSHQKMLQKAGFPCRNTVVPGQLFQLIDSHQPVISDAFLGAVHLSDNCFETPHEKEIRIWLNF